MTASTRSKSALRFAKLIAPYDSRNSRRVAHAPPARVGTVPGMIDLDVARDGTDDQRLGTRAAASTSHSLSHGAGVALFGWCGLVVVGYLLVRDALGASVLSLHDAAPLYATFDPRITVWVVVVIGCAWLGVTRGPRLACALSWRRLLWTSWGAAAVWAAALAATRGTGRITAVFERNGEYLAVLPSVHSVGAFLDQYVARIRSFPVHVQGHPPGFVLVAWALERVGLGGSFPASVLCITVGAAAIPAVLVTVRAVAGADRARRAAPFLVLAPFAISIATSADAFFAGVGAWAVALVVVATGRRDRRGDASAVVGGVLFGVTAFLSYGLVLLAVIPLVVALQRRRVRPLLLAAFGALPVFAAFALAGFWWVDGLLATRRQYFVGIASYRPYGVYVIANFAAFAIIVGPAVAPALVRLRDRRLWLVVGAALLAVALADVSGMSKAEVERIWLPFAPFVLAATAALSAGATTVQGVVRVPRSLAAWIALQAGFTIFLEALVRTGW